MADYEATSTPPMQSPPRSSLILPCKSSQEDHSPTKRPSDDASTIIDSDIQSKDGTPGPWTAMPTSNSIPSTPPNLEHDTWRQSILTWIENIQPEEPCDYFFSEFMFIIIHPRELWRYLGHDPSNLLEESDAQHLGAAIEKVNVDRVFAVYSNEDVVVYHEVFVNWNKIYSVDEEIGAMVDLLKTECREGGLGLLELDLRRIIDIVYLATISVLEHSEFVKSEKLEVFWSLGLYLRRKATEAIEI
ncbi:hypothetical protein FCOIX_5924 [Fusarium coicis]|nr:hypothetical protein FCOIX_5924 [Fusarium coicis]